MSIPSVQGLPKMAELTLSHFDAISSMVRQRCGINLHDGKIALVKARLNKRLRALGLASFADYVEFLRNDAGGTEIASMLDALLTNLTYFFREPRHFDALRERFIPEIAASRRHARRIRIWSAGCSSGEEPYSIAMVIREIGAALAGWDIGILATDFSSQALERAREGAMRPQQLQQLASRLVQEHFTLGDDDSQRCYRVKQSVRSLVHFARLNLMERWPMKGPFEAIFCRNVMIYFDKPTQQGLVERFWEILRPAAFCLSVIPRV